jgi:hypothetical protein
MWAWFEYVAKGLYYYELTKPFQVGTHCASSNLKASNSSCFFGDPIGGEKAERREYASGEIRYIFSRNDAEEIAGWLMTFKSIDMAWFTVGPQSATIRWPEPLQQVILNGYM